MSSAIGGLSAAKRRRGSSQSTNTASRQQTISAPQNDINSNMIQVSPLEMLKMHESRLRRIESMENGTDKQLPDFDEVIKINTGANISDEINFVWEDSDDDLPEYDNKLNVKDSKDMHIAKELALITDSIAKLNKKVQCLQSYIWINK